jgi:extracellular factor (EF) 3-hydroxypalmitic acid methyl ester biosynthesis protein
MFSPAIDAHSQAEPTRWQHLAGAVDELKEALDRADRAALRHSGEVPVELEAEIRWRFRSFCLFLDKQLGADAPDPPHVKEALGARVRRELLPYLLLTGLAERLYSKPRGYPGDFMSIELLYGDTPSGCGRIGPLVDRCFLDQPAAVAVRNRRRLMAGTIAEMLVASGGGTSRVTSLGCGPATELFDVYEVMPDPSQLLSTVVDFDLEALEFVGARRDRLQIGRCMMPIRANLVSVARGKQALPLRGQDLVYSVGLIDYCPDPLVIALLGWIYETLRPGGKVVLGNFHPMNPSRALMEHVLDWKLIHRTEEDMHRLFRASRFRRPCSEIRFEAEGINLFACASRPDEPASRSRG